jgi:threonine/homoserine/homoserine lactone efflux protein
MQTGNVSDWNATMTDVGPLYPFVGTELLWVGLAFVLWIVWHIWQARMESSNYTDDLAKLKQNGNMERALKGEKILRSM